MVELPELKQEVFPVLSYFEDAVLARRPLRVLGDGGPKNLKVFTAGTVLFSGGPSPEVSTRFSSRLF